MVPLLRKCGCLPLSLRVLVCRVFLLVWFPSLVLFNNNSGVLPLRPQPEYRVTHSQPNTPLNGHKKWRCGVRWCHVASDAIPAHFGPKCPIRRRRRRRLVLLARRSKRRSRRRRRTPKSARAARRGREYELVWLLQQRLRAVSWPQWRLRCMQPSQPLLGHGIGVVRP